jgi:hypothetical protein
MYCVRTAYFDVEKGGGKEKKESVSQIAEMKEQNVSRLF